MISFDDNYFKEGQAEPEQVYEYMKSIFKWVDKKGWRINENESGSPNAVSFNQLYSTSEDFLNEFVKEENDSVAFNGYQIAYDVDDDCYLMIKMETLDGKSYRIYLYYYGKADNPLFDIFK